MMLPHDPAMLLSVVNTKLRDEYESLDELCAAEDAEPEKITAALAALGYAYDAKQNRFL
ncbi:MAG: DUF4250 domain-containing protein [Ruminococcaceae bacterium]|nr:DUF4250 domain-containing protein [Oscillospiraceae bacterium]